MSSSAEEYPHIFAVDGLSITNRPSRSVRKYESWSVSRTARNCLSLCRRANSAAFRRPLRFRPGLDPELGARGVAESEVHLERVEGFRGPGDRLAHRIQVVGMHSGEEAGGRLLRFPLLEVIASREVRRDERNDIRARGGEAELVERGGRAPDGLDERGVGGRGPGLAHPRSDLQFGRLDSCDGPPDMMQPPQRLANSWTGADNEGRSLNKHEGASSAEIRR